MGRWGSDTAYIRARHCRSNTPHFSSSKNPQLRSSATSLPYKLDALSIVAFIIKGGIVIGNGELFVIHELRHQGLSISAITTSRPHRAERLVIWVYSRTIVRDCFN